MNKPFDPYAELAVPRDATAPEVKAAFRKRAKKVHPDKPGTGDPEAFKRAHRALTLLSDPGRRERFDRTGDAEEEKPDNIRATALQIIEAFIAGAMDEYVRGGMKPQDDPRRRDMVAAFKLKMRHEIIEIENGFIQAKHVRAFFEDMGARFETKDPTDPIRRANETRLRSVDAQVATMREALASRKLALEIIQLYRSRADTSPFTGGFA